MTTSTDPADAARRLGLGTVQLGMRYGIANGDDLPSATEAVAIVERARDLGFGALDTAPRYGEAEARIGLASLGRREGGAACGLGEMRVVTKTDAHHGGDQGAEIVGALRRSLAAMGVSSVHALLEHRPAELLEADGDALWRGLEHARDEGLTARIGVSAGDPETLDEVVERFPVEVVQVPVNVLDRRFVRPDRLERLADRGVEVHARSVFLQGALLAPPGVSSSVPRLPGLVAAFQECCHAAGLRPIEAALGYVLSLSEVAHALVGAVSIEQVEELGAAARSAADLGGFDDWSDLATDDAAIVDPSRWGVAR